MTTPPLAPFTPSTLDPDWETIRARIMRALATHAPIEHSDHNPIDPGVTVAEAAAFAIADLHYRAAERTLDAWPLEPAGREPHWPAPLGSPVTVLAAALAATLDGETFGSRIEVIAREASSRDEAIIVARALPGIDTLLDAATLDSAITLARAPLVLQAALEGTPDPPLWPEEMAALIRRERRRAAAEGEHSADEELLLRAIDPPLAGPDELEEGGASRLWPPGPVQALTCEPVTAEDYARRARTHDHVQRAWAVPGRLGGVRWDGTPLPAGSINPHALGALTLVLELDVPATPALLREVLANAVGMDSGNPYAQIVAPPELAGARRTICEEIGATALRRAEITVRAHLIIGAATNAAEVITGVRARIAEYFAAGRPESRLTTHDAPQIDGPWPPNAQPADGWNPGEPIRFTEITQAILADGAVRGVEKLGLKRGTGTWVYESASILTLAVDPDEIPVLAPTDCLEPRLVLDKECGNA